MKNSIDASRKQHELIWLNIHGGIQLMNISKAKEVVISVIDEALEGKAEITEDMQLIGGESLLDSMKLVEVCLALEDVADEH